MRVKSIQIVFIDGAGREITCNQAQDFLWRISGPIYPRIMKLLAYLGDWRKENDFEVKQRDRDAAAMRATAAAVDAARVGAVPAVIPEGE